MIYLIGGPPKCGKTTLAKKLSKKLQVPWVSTDTLQVLTRQYISKYISKEEVAKLYPHSSQKAKTNDKTYSKNSPKQIAKNYIRQAKASYKALDLFSLCEMKDGNDYIIEGYHVTPELVASLIKKHGPKDFRACFLVRSDIHQFIIDSQKSSTPNDWVISKTHNKETLAKIAEMISHYSNFIEKEAKKYKQKAFNMDKKFQSQLEKAVKYLSS